MGTEGGTEALGAQRDAEGEDSSVEATHGQISRAGDGRHQGDSVGHRDVGRPQIESEEAQDEYKRHCYRACCVFISVYKRHCYRACYVSGIAGSDWTRPSPEADPEGSWMRTRSQRRCWMRTWRDLQRFRMCEIR